MSYEDRFDDPCDDYAFTLTDDRDQGAESFGREYLHLHAWFAANFSTHEALALQNSGITLSEAIGFRDLGIDLPRAQMLVTAGYGPDNLALTEDGEWLLGEHSLAPLSQGQPIDLIDLHKVVSSVPPGPRRGRRAERDSQPRLFDD